MCATYLFTERWKWWALGFKCYSTWRTCAVKLQHYQLALASSFYFTLLGRWPLIIQADRRPTSFSSDVYEIVQWLSIIIKIYSDTHQTFMKKLITRSVVYIVEEDVRLIPIEGRRQLGEGNRFSLWGCSALFRLTLPGSCTLFSL